MYTRCQALDGTRRRPHAHRNVGGCVTPPYAANAASQLEEAASMSLLPSAQDKRFSPHDTQAVIDAHHDRGYLVEMLSALAKVPTDVPLGYDTLMAPDDPKLVHYVQEVLRPELVRIGCYDLVDASGNNLIVRLGTGESGESLLLQNYTPAQHHNLMDAPFSGRVSNAAAYGRDEPAVFGQGVSQNKAHQAVMLAVLKLLRTPGITLRGRLYWAINNEGRSSHACSEAILAALPEKP